MKEDIDAKCSQNVAAKVPNIETTRLYEMLNYNDDYDVHLVKTSTKKDKDKRRQMVSTSIYNLASRVAAVAYSNFRSVPKKWEAPKKLTKGATLFVKIIKSITGTHVKPIFPAYFLNKYCSSQYSFAGTTMKHRTKNGWARVKTASLLNRNKGSICFNIDTKEGVCKCIRVKYECSGAAPGFIYPICVNVSGLSKEELTTEDFWLCRLKVIFEQTY